MSITVTTSRKSNDKWEEIVSIASSTGVDSKHLNRIRILTSITKLMNETYKKKVTNKDIYDLLYNSIPIELYDKTKYNTLYIDIYYILQCNFENDFININDISSRLHSIIKG